MGFRANKLKTLKVDSDDDQTSEHANCMRRLFYAITRQALKDIEMSLDKGHETKESKETYEWFWSKDFSRWCELVDIDENDYRFKNLKKIITEKKKAAKYNNMKNKIWGSSPPLNLSQ
jgi:hypothetical protein